MPTNTDLVSQLPADFEVFGQAVDTSLADLKGGTTGQVLKKNTNADMDFVWSADSAGMTNPMTTTGDTIYSSSGSTPARLGIGSTGQVLTVAAGVPSWANPASTTPTFVGCSVYASAVQSIPNNTATLLTFDSEDFDSDAFHSTATNTGRITIPTGKGGKYNIQAFGQWAASTSGRRYMYLYKNGAEYALQETAIVPYAASLTWYFEMTVSAVATDYFELYALQTSGGAIDTRVTGDGTAGNQIVGRYQATFVGA